MTEFRLLNKNKLDALVNEPAFLQSPIFCITHHRAMAQLKNPRAAENDVLMILATDEGQIVGYLGLLPDTIFISSGPERCAWASCLWVAESQRGKGLAVKLMQEGLREFDNKILSTDYAPGTDKLYYKTGAFATPLAKHGLKMFMRLDMQTILPPRKNIFRKMKGILKLADAFGNVFINLRMKWVKDSGANMKHEFLQHADEEIQSFLTDFHPHELFRRGVPELNWILKHPWLLSPPAKDVYAGKYYFSAWAKDFYQDLMKVRNDKNELIAVLLLTRKGRALKTPHIWMKKGAVEVVGPLMKHLLLKWKVATFSTFHPALVEWFTRNPMPALKRRQMNRELLLTHATRDGLPTGEFYWHEGDGDPAFT